MRPFGKYLVLLIFSLLLQAKLGYAQTLDGFFGGAETTKFLEESVDDMPSLGDSGEKRAKAGDTKKKESNKEETEKKPAVNKPPVVATKEFKIDNSDKEIEAPTSMMPSFSGDYADKYMNTETVSGYDDVEEAEIDSEVPDKPGTLATKGMPTSSQDTDASASEDAEFDVKKDKEPSRMLGGFGKNLPFFSNDDGDDKADNDDVPALGDVEKADVPEELPDEPGTLATLGQPEATTAIEEKDKKSSTEEEIPMPEDDEMPLLGIDEGDKIKAEKDGPAFGDYPGQGSGMGSGAEGISVKDMPDVGDKDQKDRIQAKAKPKRSFGTNASRFDIAGIRLGTNLREAMGIAYSKGYTKLSERREVPNFAKWRYETECKSEGIFNFEKVAECIVTKARLNNNEFIEFVSFVKYATKERLEIYLTSNFTGNKVQKIIYSVTGNVSLGDSGKSNYIRGNWEKSFWLRINKKYGSPDDKERIMWGLGENKPYLVARVGKLILVDPTMQGKDYYEMSKADKGDNYDGFSF